MGESGRSVAPAVPSDLVFPLRTALAELADNARSGRTAHPCDVRFGQEVGRVQADAQRQIDARARPPQAPTRQTPGRKHGLPQ